jgi:hypothetical protein
VQYKLNWTNQKPNRANKRLKHDDIMDTWRCMFESAKVIFDTNNGFTYFKYSDFFSFTRNFSTCLVLGYRWIVREKSRECPMVFCPIFVRLYIWLCLNRRRKWWQSLLEAYCNSFMVIEWSLCVRLLCCLPLVFMCGHFHIWWCTVVQLNLFCFIM